MASSNSPCAACKYLRRKCTRECVFSPYFLPDQPQKFANVHKVFGASNVAKLLNELSASQREDTVNSLVYEADARLCDPVYGCMGLISILQHRLKQVQHDLHVAKKELTSYIDPSAMLPLGHPQYRMLHPHMATSSPSMAPFGVPTPVSLGLQQPMQAMVISEQQQLLEAQQMVAMAAREHEMTRSYEQQQQQQQQLQELVRFNSGFEGGGGGGGVHGFNQISSGHSQLALVRFENQFQVQDQKEYLHHHHQRTGSDGGRSGIGPSS